MRACTSTYASPRVCTRLGRCASTTHITKRWLLLVILTKVGPSQNHVVEEKLLDLVEADGYWGRLTEEVVVKVIETIYHSTGSLA
jgi:hypothetical protein